MKKKLNFKQISIIIPLFVILQSHGVNSQSLRQKLNDYNINLQNYKNNLLKFAPNVITLSGGAAWASAGKTQTIYLQPDVVNSYIANNNTSAIGTGEIFLGYQDLLYKSVSSQLGLAIAGSGRVNLSGSIWQDANQDFDNFVYSYKVSQLRLALKGKLIAENNILQQHIQPYISGSVGVGFNYSYYYHSIPTIFQAVPEPGFSSHTDTTFTYTLGAGIQKFIHKNWNVGIGYEFASWGKSSLGTAQSQTINGGLNLNHLYTNSLQFSISYIS